MKSAPAITSPKGFRAAGIHCGLKKTDAPDLALVLSDVPRFFCSKLKNRKP